MSIEDILNEREKTHGNYTFQSRTAQDLKRTMGMMPNWSSMPPYMRESLELIATKIARMGHGDFCEPEHSRDGSGYFSLIARELERDRGTKDTYRKVRGRHEHRRVMEELLGRPLTYDDVIHHRDGNKRNNHPDNLELMTRSEHMKAHKEDLMRGRKDAR